MRFSTFLCIALWFTCLSAHAQTDKKIESNNIPENRVLTSVYSLEIGCEHAFNTYLSPLPHIGSTYAISGNWERPMGSSPVWDMQIDVRARFGTMRNPAHNATMNDLCIGMSWAARREFYPISSLSLYAGAGALLDADLLYLPRNSNNPVAARAYLGATLNGGARYNFKIWNRNFRLIDDISIPTLGLFFSPHFGQSYYEIYLGDTSGLARCGWWGNHFSLSNLIALEVPVCDIRLRLGYRFEVTNSLASHINSRITTHSFVLGISTDWLNVTRRHE